MTSDNDNKHRVQPWLYRSQLTQLSGFISGVVAVIKEISPEQWQAERKALVDECFADPCNSDSTRWLIEIYDANRPKKLGAWDGYLQP
jgi:hypothetical protein